MRRFICFLCLTLTIAALCACGGEAAPAETVSSPPETAAEPSPSPVAVPEKTAAPTASEKQTPTELSENSDILNVLTQGKTTQYATDGQVSDDDLDAILRAGLNAPSAMNYQPWHFSVVTDTELLKDLGDEVLKVREYKRLERFNIWNTTLAIVISQTNNLSTDSFDCGLACEAMSVTAQYLGYGTKILAHPNLVLNGDKQEEYRKLFAIPDDHTAIAILIIGVPDETVDAVSSASTRRDFNESVSFVE